jgi:hypothetical protein
MRNIMPVKTDTDEPLTVLIVTRHWAFPEDGTNEEYAALAKEFHENVTHKNPYLVGFYNHRHRWGSDGRDMQNVFLLKSLEDLPKMQDEQGKLVEAHWPDEAARKEFFAKFNKYYTPFHSDKIFQTEPTLSKGMKPSATE